MGNALVDSLVLLNMKLSSARHAAVDYACTILLFVPRFTQG